LLSLEFDVFQEYSHRGVANSHRGVAIYFHHRCNHNQDSHSNPDDKSDHPSPSGSYQEAWSDLTGYLMF